MVEFAIPTGPISTVLWIALAPDGDVWFTEWSANKIGVVHTNLAVPFTIAASENHVGLPIGGQASLSLVLNNSQGIAGYGAYVYSWPSYNPTDVNVTFSSSNESLTNHVTVSSQATIKVSTNTLPGHYLLGLGFDAGSVRVWTMVQTDVSAQTTITALMMNNPWLPVGAIITALIVVVVLEIRIRRSKREKGPRR
jgi:hypothetical protein